MKIIDPCGMYKKYNKEEKDRIIYCIISGELMLEEVVAKFDVSRISVVKWLKERQPEIDAYFKESHVNANFLKK